MNTKRRRLIAAVLVLFIALTVVALKQSVFAPNDPNVQPVILGEKRFLLEVADTPMEREIGLSGRDTLTSDHGMLFVFEKPELHCFWMKDTRIALDMLWFDANYRLIHRAMGVTPDTYPTSFCSPRPAKYVVELPGGTSEQLNLKLDDVLSLL